MNYINLRLKIDGTVEMWMEEMYITELLGLGIILIKLVVKGAATISSSKIKAIKDEEFVWKIFWRNI